MNLFHIPGPHVLRYIAERYLDLKSKVALMGTCRWIRKKMTHHYVWKDLHFNDDNMNDEKFMKIINSVKNIGHFVSTLSFGTKSRLLSRKSLYDISKHFANLERLDLIAPFHSQILFGPLRRTDIDKNLQQHMENFFKSLKFLTITKYNFSPMLQGMLKTFGDENLIITILDDGKPEIGNDNVAMSFVNANVIVGNAKNIDEIFFNSLKLKD